MIIRHSFGLLIGLITWSLLIPHAEGATYKVIIYNDGNQVAQGLGVWISEDVLLTSSAIVALGDQVFIEDSAGTRYLAELKSHSGSLALLSVEGLSISTVATLAVEPPQENSDIYFSLLNGSQRRGVLLFEATGDSLWDHQYRFTVPVNQMDVGAPLVNRCEQLISVVSTQTDSNGKLGGLSESYAAVISFLMANSVAFTVASAPCPTVEDQLSQEKELRETLQEDLNSLKSELKSLEDLGNANLEQSEDERKRLESQKNELERQIRNTEEKLVEQDSILQINERLQDSLRKDLDSLREKSSMQRDSLTAQRDSLIAQGEQKSRELLLVGVISAILILIALIFLFLFWKRRRDVEEELIEADIRLHEAEEAADKKPDPFPDILLSGLGPNNEEIRAKISGESLVQRREGLLIGRSSAHADCVIVESSVSRRHARISLINKKLIIQDLGSLNGTTVNGIRLVPEKNHPLPQKAKIVLGEVELELTILQ